MLIACVVGCCQVHSISSVDQQKQQITVSYYEYQQWVDPRLSFDTEAEALCVLGAGTDDYTWIPLDEVNNHNKNLVVTGDRSPGTSTTTTTTTTTTTYIPRAILEPRARYLASGHRGARRGCELGSTINISMKATHHNTPPLCTT